MIYSCILTKPLKEKITIEKLGITLEPLTVDEKEGIMNRMDKLYFSDRVKRKILKYVKLNQMEEKEERLKLLYQLYKNLNEDEVSSCFMYKKFLESGKKITKNIVKKTVNNTVKISVSEKFNEFVDKEFERSSINEIFEFCLYINDKIDFNNITLYINNFKDYNTLDIVDFSIIYSNLSEKREHFYEELELTYENLIDFKMFIEKLNVERIRDFIIITENLFNSNNIRENRIISNVSILERLLIKHDTNYDIGKQFVLKIGLLLKEYDKFPSKGSSILTYCYAIRSCLVHGDDKSIVNLPKKYLKTDEKELNELMPANTHYSKRDRAVFLCHLFINSYIKTPLHQWVYNTEKIEFLKNN